MKQENIIKVVTGAAMAAKNTTDMLKEKGTNYIAENVIKNNYVSREEYEQLKKLVIKMEKELSQLKSVIKK